MLPGRLERNKNWRTKRKNTMEDGGSSIGLAKKFFWAFLYEKTRTNFLANPVKWTNRLYSGVVSLESSRSLLKRWLFHSLLLHNTPTPQLSSLNKKKVLFFSWVCDPVGAVFLSQVSLAEVLGCLIGSQTASLTWYSLPAISSAGAFSNRSHFLLRASPRSHKASLQSAGGFQEGELPDNKPQQISISQTTASFT